MESVGCTILVVEDDQNIAELARLYLASRGYAVVVAHTGGQALREIEQRQVDLIVLDLMLPDISGWSICHRIRQQNSIPIIILTAKGDIHDKLLGFELGADDYIVKPFDPLELVARVATVLKRSLKQHEAAQVVTWPGLSIDMARYEVRVGGQKVELTPKEIELLCFLASHPNRIFTREYLLKEVWGYDYVGTSRTVDMHVSRLRDKVERRGLPWSIKTVRGVGYKFEVEEVQPCGRGSS
jgi:DNA-binding response OmpR family regulator